MHEFIVFLFSIAAGMTVSGLFASAYRMVAHEPQTKLALVLHYTVMVVAGPAMLAGNSTQSFRDKQCSRIAYALALAFSGYWAFAMGVLILSLAVRLNA